MAFVNSGIALLMTLDIISIPLGIIASIVLGIQARKVQDPIAKKFHKRWAWRSLFGPIGVLLLLVIIDGVVILAASTINS
ncbi:MAG TPA: hypothetical protein VG102_03470 [Candidatus Paceibacterota bacterium]|jgi:uncharacterized membrane protein|nr:hypothetical protein [Candidatus Paceibacterota bacterium]